MPPSPPRVHFLSFRLTNFLKRSRVGSQRPPQEILDPLLLWIQSWLWWSITHRQQGAQVMVHPPWLKNPWAESETEYQWLHKMVIFSWWHSATLTGRSGFCYQARDDWGALCTNQKKSQAMMNPPGDGQSETAVHKMERKHCKKALLVSAGHLCDLWVLLMRIQNLVTLFMMLCDSLIYLNITEKTSQNWRHIYRKCVFRHYYSLNNHLIF